MRHPVPKSSIVKFPGGKQSSGKGLSLSGLVKWPAIQGSSAVTHPGYSVTVPPYEWDRRLLDLDSLGAAVTTGLSIRAKPVVVQMLDLVIWANGIDAVQVYEPSSGNVYNLGIAQPAAAPGLADSAGGGTFAGDYLYWIRWYRSTTGEFSALSTEAQHTASGSNDAITVTWTDPSLTGVDKAQIFRSKTGQTGIYLVATVDITAETYDDSTADSAIDITLVPPALPAPGEPSTVPTFDYIIPYQGRLFGLDVSTNRMYWSEQNSPWLFASDSFCLVGPEDRDKLSGFGVSQERLFIFKERHTYVLASTDFMVDDTYVFVPEVRLVDDSTGAASQHAVTTVENSLMFMSGEGKIYQAPSERGLVAMERSVQLEETLKGLHTNRLKAVELGYAELERKVFVAIPTGESAFNNETLVFDLTHNGWTTSDLQAESLHEYRDSDGRGRLCFGNVRGDIAQIGVGSGFGARDGTIRGTPSAGTLSTLTDSTAAFDTGVVGLPIDLFDAYWNHVQSNMIAVRNSATQVTTLWAWKTIPDTTHHYVIGGMFPTWRTGIIEFGDWGVISMIRVNFVQSQGKGGIYVSVDDGPMELQDVIDLAGDGHHEASPMIGGKRGQIEVRGFNGASDMRVVSIDVDIDVTEGGI